ncbi:PAS domain-containing sensor histidine kinase [Desulfosarcina alkanivorans]|uniref:histidine kinase n=1 Tax=Desulfosarcina alkanivorans TaxID=571177 RepID=A0A5K7Z4I2_9BACT|nr:PAS domain S-box protein [Desulfosarcina alkanivorans]BBO71537.1 PAS domain-containing sensor histidine kinase [Desulfosarcina alkanivorans]
MIRLIDKLRNSLASKLILTVGIVLLFTIATWAFFNIRHQKEKMMKNMVAGTDRLTTTIRLGTHYAMMLNARDEINQIINNISRQPEIEKIRIYNKLGEIKYSNNPEEVEQTTNIKAEACDICHRSDPPVSSVPLEERTRIFPSEKGHRLIGIISPICNEPGCSTGDCHVHPEGKKILGALDVVISLEKTDHEILLEERGIIGLAVFVFLITAAIIFVFVLRFVNQPIKRLIDGTRLIARGDYTSKVQVKKADELGQLATAINQMSDDIASSQKELNKQRDEYQNLFERVPCLITVQDRNYRLLRFNREFHRRFAPEPGDYCYHAYKGRTEKCISCPVEKTFADGLSHQAEESGLDKDGSAKHWLVRTSPIKNVAGQVVAAMEISLDISHRRQLEVDLQKSEKKYHAIFSNIPNPVFVLDVKTLQIMDCNKSVTAVYGYSVEEIVGQSFMTLFHRDEQDHYAFKVVTCSVINQARHLNRDGKSLFVNIRISPSEYSGQKVLLVTTSDITKRLETEQQLIQASKMATLGEMATGVAHELNQPLSVIKTVSSFFMKKLAASEAIALDVLSTMLGKVDSNVDRAARIINHMRQFARKSDMETVRVQLNDVLRSAFEIFSQQLKVRGIRVIWEIREPLPRINADPSRLEQVFINLLLNARDAIESRWGDHPAGGADNEKAIRLLTDTENGWVVCRVCDTGTGIADNMVEKIFEPFFTTKEVGKGTGLGLSISYGIVKEYGGIIEAVPNAPRGTCFVLRFPCSDESVAAPGPMKREAGVSHG